VVGATVTVVATGACTVTVAVPVTVPLVALTVAVPAAAPVTVTVAPFGVSVTTPVGVTDHVTAALGIGCPF
jgi:hypothetical protein